MVLSGPKTECGSRGFGVFSEGKRQGRSFRETKYGHTRPVTKSGEKCERGVTLLRNDLSQTSGLVQREEHGDTVGAARSEERRVGKECRSRRLPYVLKKK